MVRKGNWKLLNTILPYDSSNIQLFNLTDDLAEIHDLKEQEPGVVNELILEWEKYKEEAKIMIPFPDPEE